MIDVHKLTPVTFHSYTSSARDRIFEVEYTSDSDIDSLEKELVELFNKEGIKNVFGGKVRRDNKVVFEVIYQGLTLYYGFYDWIFSIGLSYYSEHESMKKYVKAEVEK